MLGSRLRGCIKGHHHPLISSKECHKFQMLSLASWSDIVQRLQYYQVLSCKAVSVDRSVTINFLEITTFPACGTNGYTDAAAQIDTVENTHKCTECTYDICMLNGILDSWFIIPMATLMPLAYQSYVDIH